MAEVKLSLEEYHNLLKGLNTLIKKLYEMAKEGNDYKRQRDELINDMAEVKRKAEAFDEIVNAIEESANSYELVARIKLEVLKYQKLERGSDDI